MKRVYTTALKTTRLNRPVELVLHRGEETFSGLRRYVVVDGRGIDVRDLLVELAFGQTNLADALELLLKVAFRQDKTAAFQPLVVHRKTFNGELLDNIVVAHLRNCTTRSEFTL